MSKTNNAGCAPSFFAKGSSARTNAAQRRGAGIAARAAAGETLSAEERAALKRYESRKAAADAAYEAWKAEETARGEALKAKATEARAAEQAKQDAARKAIQDAAIAQYLADPASLPAPRAAWCKAELERRAGNA